MLLRTLFLLLAAVGCYAVETPVLGSGAPPASSSIFPSGVIPTAGQVVFSDGTTLAGDAGLKYTAASNLFAVNHNGAALPATPAADEMVMQVGGKDGTTTRLIIDGFGGVPSFVGRAAVGTNAAKTAVVNNTGLVQMVAFGYDGSAYQGGKGTVIISGSETWSGSQTGTKLAINLTPAGSTTNTNIITLTPTLWSQVQTDAVTGAVTAAINIIHATSGTAAVGFGTGIQFQGYDDGSTIRTMGSLTNQWTDAASATRSSKVTFSLVVNTATVAALNLQPATATFIATDAATATATTVATFQHATSGTAANSFGSAIVINGPDDGGTQRGMATIQTQWTTAASATRASQLKFAVQVAAVSTTGFTLNATNATFASGFPVTISDTTASTTTGTGALIVAGGAGIAGQLTATNFVANAGNVQITSAGRFNNASAVTTAPSSGVVSMWRSGGTIGTAGDMVLQTDSAADSSFVFRSGITTPATVATISAAFPAATTPGFVTAGNSLIAGGVTDAYTSSHRLSPTYTGAFTVTRHNYFDINQPILASSAVVTDAPLFRFDAAIGTHKTVNSGTTKTSPGTVTAWIVININGTLHYIPCYASKTSMVSPIERAVRATITLPTEPDDRVSYVRATEAA